MKIIRRGQAGDAPAERRTATFTGLVYADPLGTGDGVTFASVFFAPGARTHWHWHEGGQLLHVLTGHGLICAEGGRPTPLRPGDLVWTPPGERHWHGGGPETVMAHLAVSLGTTNWLDAVSDDEYGDLR
ncbi:cupin domain-containing protein [Actinoallomurus acaciae]|uniref:Cupin domain-containing protein n=1 Tax=Actinoallomurus acaciae TaxID=502577 RepID=A0ABV5YA49_9ACTN